MASTRIHRALYIALFATANLLSIWSFQIAGMTFFLGSITMVVAYALLDVVNDVNGKLVARHTVIQAATARVVVFLGLLIVAWVEPTARTLALSSLSMLLASEAAMIVSQYCVDIPIFDALKRRLHSPFWVRYNVSNLVSQPLAAAIFSLGAAWTFEKSYLSVFLGACSLRVLALPILLTPLVQTWQPSK